MCLTIALDGNAHLLVLLNGKIKHSLNFLAICLAVVGNFSIYLPLKWFIVENTY